jgi:D-alanine-D-alanine ligase
VALVFGGRSSEHSISCISAAAVWEALEEAGHRVVPIAMTPRAGLVAYDFSPADLRADQLPVVEHGERTVHLPMDPSVHGVLIDGDPIRVDVVFPVLHGPWGEDGTIQGVCELAGVPYVGSGVLASALCMDKITMKQVLQATGVPVMPWVAVSESAWESAREDLIARIADLGPIVFVKPSRAGSSMGITRVDLGSGGKAPLIDAIETARGHDPRVIVEQAAAGAREIECGVRQLPGGGVQASRCAQIVVRPGFDFYDFDAKYLADGAELLVPAPMSDELHERAGELANRAFAATGCEGLARVDFFVMDDSHIVVNEVNTMPGFTPISMFPRMWEESGVPYSELVDSLVREAHARRAGLR